VEPSGPDPAPRRAHAGGAELAREKAYVRAIEKRFLALRESGLILSSRDFEIVHDWFERGVPAQLVIATLEQVYAKTADRPEGRSIQSIAYCRRAVERAWEERRAALLGTGTAAADSVSAQGSGGGAFTKEQIAAHLASVAASTRNAAQALAGVHDGSGKALVEIADRLAELAAGTADRGAGELPALEDELVTLEDKAVAAARSALPASEIEAIGAKAAQDTAGASSRMSAKAREAMLRRATEAALRRRLALPRYSLFTMTA